MRGIRKASIGLVIGAASLLIVSPMSSATVFTVGTEDYSRNESLDPSAPVDRYELRATSGDAVQYSAEIEAGNGCLQLYFSKGHNLGSFFEYLVTYSQDNCVGSYSNSFLVGSSDGTDFTITITTTVDFEMNYTMNIKRATSSVPTWFCPLLAVIMVIVIVVAVVLAVRSRKKKAAMQPPPFQLQPLWEPPPPPPPRQ